MQKTFTFELGEENIGNCFIRLLSFGQTLLRLKVNPRKRKNCELEITGNEQLQRNIKVQIKFINMKKNQQRVKQLQQYIQKPQKLQIIISC